MIVSKKILNQWIDVKKIKDQELAKALNTLGFEVEKVVNLTSANTNLIVGEILKVEKHPNSKKLSFCYVNIGRKISKIICGANNVRVGIKVVVAQIGSKLANGLIIESREILDVTSNGMICSFSELGLNPEVLSQEDLDGIIYLPDDAPIGSLNPLSYLDLDDSIFEIQLTLNRSDCLAMYYLAQELSHFFKLPLKKIAVSNFKTIQTIKQNHHDAISAFSSLQINLLAQSKKINDNWIRRTLQLANIKPKLSFFDNLVSIVMLELGQPVVAFNADELKTLNLSLIDKDYLSKDLHFFKNDLVFKNENQCFSNLAVSTLPNYLVAADTKKIIFASLNLKNDFVQNQIKRNNFSPGNLFLQRLNKPVVPVNYLLVLQRILYLLNQFEIKYEILGFSNLVAYQAKSNVCTINYQKINQLLGTFFSLNEIVFALKAINCQIIKGSKILTSFKINVPAYRSDLNNINDFAEEVARIIGYNNLPVVRPKFASVAFSPSKLEVLLAQMRTYLLQYGFHQVKTYTLTSKESLADFNFFDYKKPVTLISQINQTRKVMRFSLIASLLEICRFNVSYKQNKLKIFTDEVIYNNNQDDLNRINHHLAFVINNDFFEQQKNLTSETNNYLLVKGFLSAWLTKQGGNEFSDALIYQSFKDDSVHPYLSSEIKYNNIHFATIATLHPQISKAMDLSNEVFLVEINFTRLANILNTLKENQVTKFENWSKFNLLSRDLSIIISEDVEYSSIKDAIWSAKTKSLQSLTLIDIYCDEKLKQKKKYSLTFNLEFNSKKEQLDEIKIASEIKIIQEILASRFHAQIR
ncbi:MAG: phenylalanine--tRNA ligase subunit beta [Spiroplasma sp.]